MKHVFAYSYSTVLRVNLKSFKHKIDETLLSEKNSLSCAYYVSQWRSLRLWLTPFM